MSDDLTLSQELDAALDFGADDTSAANADSPASADQPETAGEPEAEATADPSADPAAQPRDQSGRFAPKGETADSGAPAPTDAPVPVPEPYAVQANRTTVTPLEGAQMVRAADGSVTLTIPAPAVQRHQQLISSGLAAPAELQRRDAEIRSLRQQMDAPRPPSENEVAAAVVMEMIGKLQQGDPDVAELAANPVLFWKSLHTEARGRYYDVQQKHGETVKQYQAQAAQQDAEQGLATSARETYEAELATLAKEFPALTAADWQAIRQHTATDPRLIVRATAQHVASGLAEREGEPLFNDPLLRSVVEDRAALRKEAAAVATRATQAGKFNDAVNGGTKPAAAKPQPKRQPATTAKAAADPRSPGKKQWDEFWKGDNWLDSDD